MKRMIVVLTLLSVLCGCTKTVYINSDGEVIETPPTKFDGHFEVIYKSDKLNYQELRHIETGVHYIYVYGGDKGGLAPLYELDGTIRVSK